MRGGAVDHAEHFRGPAAHSRGPRRSEVAPARARHSMSCRVAALSRSSIGPTHRMNQTTWLGRVEPIAVWPSMMSVSAQHVHPKVRQTALPVAEAPRSPPLTPMAPSLRLRCRRRPSHADRRRAARAATPALSSLTTSAPSRDMRRPFDQGVAAVREVALVRLFITY